MKSEILNLLRVSGPLCVEEISDDLMWEEELVHMVLIPLAKSGHVYAEIDGTFWFARDGEQSAKEAAA